MLFKHQKIQLNHILILLSKRHKEWLKMAIKITGSKTNAKDLVQDMYLKIGVSKCKLRDDYSNFVFTTMKNIYLNQQKRNFVNQTTMETRVFFVEYKNYD